MKKLILVGALLFVAQISAEENIKVEMQFENDQMKIMKIVLPSNQTVPLHRDEHNRVIVTLKGGKLKKVEQTGEVSTVDLETGKSYYLTPDVPGAMHTTTNISKNPVEIVVIEFKD